MVTVLGFWDTLRLDWCAVLWDLLTSFIFTFKTKCSKVMILQYLHTWPLRILKEWELSKIWKSFQVGHTAGHELKQHYAVVGYAPWYTGGHEQFSIHLHRLDDNCNFFQDSMTFPAYYSPISNICSSWWKNGCWEPFQ